MKKTLLKSLAIAAVGSLVLSVSAMAIPSNLQDITGYSGTDIYTDTGAEAVTLTDADGVNDDATAFLFLEIAAWSATNTFGIYSYTDDGAGNITVGEMLEVFAGSASPITSATLSFDLAGGTVTNSATSATANIGATFGFYLSTVEGDWGGNSYPAATWYSHTSLNSDNGDHMMLFDTSDNSVSGLLGSDVVLAWEDLNFRIGSDYDYSDMVIGISDVTPVPEPTTMLLFGTGLAGLAAIARRKREA